MTARQPSRPQIVCAAIKEIVGAGMRPRIICLADGSIEVEALPMDSGLVPSLDSGARKAGNLIEGAFGGKQASGHGAD
jgi:hypothetical protein